MALTRENGKTLRSYTVWQNIMKRCYNKKNHNYKWYGAKGVTVCKEWHSYENFKKWYDENYIEGHHIDKDNSGLNEYSPYGCSFVDASLNIADGTSRRCNDDRSGTNSRFYGMTGSMNYGSKPMSHYEECPTVRSQFKITCSRQGWNFEDFIEVYSNIKRGAHKRNYYIIKERYEEWKLKKQALID